MTRCAICQQDFSDPEKADRTKHGWVVPVGTFDLETGAPIWKSRLCADASPEEILAYRKLKQDRAKGINSKGFPNDGK